MDYVPVYADEQPETAAADIAGHAAVEMNSEGLTLAGVQTAPAVRERLARTIRTVGTVTADETRIRHVHTKIPGWVEKLFVNFTGQLVAQGRADPVDLLARSCWRARRSTCSARETASAVRRVRAPRGPEGWRGPGEGGAPAARAVRRPRGFIAELESTGEAQRTVTLVAPVSGFVTAKDVFEGQQVEPGMELFTITDLSRVWVEADFYEYEARALRARRRRRPSRCPTTRHATRRAASPTSIRPSTPDTRTLRGPLRVRATPDWRSSPAMFANVELDAEAVEGIVIPDSARHRHRRAAGRVRERRATGVFEPREVTVGVRSDGKAQVLSGVAGGRAGRGPGQLPARLGVAPARRHRGRREPAATQHGGRPMIQRIIEFSAHNRMLVLLGVAALCVLAVYTLKEIRLDALPDLSDTQVIVYSRWDRSPDIIEDQVTYPIVTALLGAPKVKAIRGFSDFGFSYVYVIFQDGTDIYWARSRVLEYLSKIQAPPARGRADRARARRHRRRLGLPVRARRPLGHALARPAPLLPGLDAALRPPVGARSGRGGLDRRLRQAVPDHRRPQPARRLRHPARHGGRRRSGARTTRSAGGCSSWRAPSTWCAAAATRDSIADFEQIVVKAGAGGVPVLLKDVAPRRARPRDPPRRLRPRRPRRPRRRHRGHAPRRERPQRHRARSRRSSRSSSRRCPRASRSSPPTTAPT